MLLQASQDSAASAATTVLTSFAKNLAVLELNWECAAGLSWGCQQHLTFSKL
jgi:hypothetical protein